MDRLENEKFGRDGLDGMLIETKNCILIWKIFHIYTYVDVIFPSYLIKSCLVLFLPVNGNVGLKRKKKFLWLAANATEFVSLTWTKFIESSIDRHISDREIEAEGVLGVALKILDQLREK